MAFTRMRDGLSRVGHPIDTCRDATGFIAREQEGDLVLSEWFRLRLHLTGCRGCADYRRQFQIVVKTLAMMPSPAVSPATKYFLLKQFQAGPNG